MRVGTQPARHARVPKKEGMYEKLLVVRRTEKEYPPQVACVKRCDVDARERVSGERYVVIPAVAQLVF